MTNESNASHIRSFVWLPNVSSLQLYAFSCLYLFKKKCTRLKNCCLILCSMFKMVFPFELCQDDWRITMLLLPATNMQHFSFQFPEPCTIHVCMLWETWRRSFAMFPMFHCGRFIITCREIGFYASKPVEMQKVINQLAGYMYFEFYLNRFSWKSKSLFAVFV